MTTPDETLHFSDDEREVFRLRAKVAALEECVRLSNESALQSAGRIRELEGALRDLLSNGGHAGMVCLGSERGCFPECAKARSLLAGEDIEPSGTARCPVCGIDEPHSLDSLRAKLREILRDIEERTRAADGGALRALKSWQDEYEEAIKKHVHAAIRARGK